MGRAHARRFRILGEALSEVHASRDVQEDAHEEPVEGRSDRLTFDEPAGREVLEALARPNHADLDAFRAGIEPLAAAGKLGALLAQFPPSFKDAPPSRGLPGAPAPSLARLSRRGRAAASKLERSRSARHWRCSTSSRPRGCRSTSRSSASRSGRTICPTSRLLLHAPPRPERREVVAPRRLGGPLRLSVLGRRAEGVLRDRRRRADAGEEAVSLHEQPLLGEVGRQCGDDQETARAAGRGQPTRRSSSRDTPSSRATVTPSRTLY